MKSVALTLVCFGFLATSGRAAEPAKKYSSSSSAAPAFDVRNLRLTYGELGSARPDNKVLPEDTLVFAFDVVGLRTGGNGRARFSTTAELVDPAGKSVVKKPLTKHEVLAQLGDDTFAAELSMAVPTDLSAGKYLCRIIVAELGRDGAPTKTVEHKIEVLAAGFGIVRLKLTADANGVFPTPGVGVAGQTVYVHLVVTGFALDAAKRPDVTLEMVIFNKDRKKTLPEPVTKRIMDEGDGKNGVPIVLPLTLNVDGGFLIELTATDKVGKKSARAYLPLRVFPRN
jgi:hypothetical protein